MKKLPFFYRVTGEFTITEMLIRLVMAIIEPALKGEKSNDLKTRPK